MQKPLEPSCRLYAILARDGRSAVVFRRGPSRRVLVLRWWLADDRLEQGQWFNGRIYEYRCDLSPDGELLIYFAANWKGALQSWTAISRPPFLTALVLWPKGDAWGGGGVFDDAKTIGLNHCTADGAQLPGRSSAWHPMGFDRSKLFPAGVTVKRWSEFAGRGEDYPIHDHRITRDGWVLADPGEQGPYSSGEYSWLFRRPEIYERSRLQDGLKLRRLLSAIYQKNGSWYVQDHEILSSDGMQLRLISGCSWADWDQNGDLLFALGGALYRLSAESASAASQDPLGDAKLVADLTALQVIHRKAPEWATRWP